MGKKIYQEGPKISPWKSGFGIISYKNILKPALS